MLPAYDVQVMFSPIPWIGIDSGYMPSRRAPLK